MPPVNLDTLPTELLRQILLHTDAITLQAVRQTCKALHQAADDDSLWRAQVQRRFRVSSRALRSRRLLAAGGVSWRILYAQWHASMRMPASRLSGNTHTAFARGRLNDRGALAWVTVASTDDCRLVAGNLRLRVILQNVAGGHPLHFHLGKASFRLTDDTIVALNDHTIRQCPVKNLDNAVSQKGRGYNPSRPSLARRARGTADDIGLPFHQHPMSPMVALTDVYAACVAECAMAWTEDGVINNTGSKRSKPSRVLGKDDFAVITIDVTVPRALFEVDALERLGSLHIPVSWGAAETLPLVAHFQDKVIWDSYKRLPGGWWVRSESSPASYW